MGTGDLGSVVRGQAPVAIRVRQREEVDSVSPIEIACFVRQIGSQEEG